VSPVKEHSLQVPHGVPSERDAPFLEPSFIHHSKPMVYEPPSCFQVPLRHIEAPVERDAHIRSLNMSSRVPSKGALQLCVLIYTLYMQHHWHFENIIVLSICLCMFCSAILVCWSVCQGKKQI
jgi:hypothetical protein